MPPSSRRLGAPRPASLPKPTAADELNRQIRDLMWRTAGRPLTPHEAAEYARLLQQWMAAVRAELVRAA